MPHIYPMDIDIFLNYYEKLLLSDKKGFFHVIFSFDKREKYLKLYFCIKIKMFMNAKLTIPIV